MNKEKAIEILLNGDVKVDLEQVEKNKEIIKEFMTTPNTGPIQIAMRYGMPHFFPPLKIPSRFKKK